MTAQLLDQEAASDERSPYQCDGRVYCSQMTSCEEAEFFLANCPGVKMDGGGDGVPCEKQWCGRGRVSEIPHRSATGIRLHCSKRFGI